MDLKLFLTYGLNCESTLLSGDRSFKELNSGSMEVRGVKKGRYVPPHLRKIGGSVSHPSDSRALDFETSNYELTSSDSDLSDGDKAVRDRDRFRSSKARISALICIQVRFLLHVFVLTIKAMSFFC